MIKLLHLISVHFLKQITQGIKKVWEKWSHAYMHTTLTSVYLLVGRVHGLFTLILPQSIRACVSVRETGLWGLTNKEELLSVSRAPWAAARVSMLTGPCPGLQVTGMLVAGERQEHTRLTRCHCHVGLHPRVCRTAWACLSVTNTHKVKVVDKLRLSKIGPLQNCVWGLLSWYNE